MERKQYAVDDLFLKVFFQELTDQELEDALAYNTRINQTCLSSENRDNFSQEQINRGFSVMCESYALIAKTIFDVHDEYGFPRAQAFCHVFLPEHEQSITIGKIAYIYAEREQSKRNHSNSKK